MTTNRYILEKNHDLVSISCYIQFFDADLLLSLNMGHSVATETDYFPLIKKYNEKDGFHNKVYYSTKIKSQLRLCQENPEVTSFSLLLTND